MPASPAPELTCLRCGKPYTRTRDDEAFTPEPLHFECRAQRCAEAEGFNTDTLHYHLSRHSFGSLSLNWEADAARQLYRRAWQIALDHNKQVAA